MRKSIAVLSLVAVFSVLIRVDYSHADSLLAVDNFDDGILDPTWEILTETAGASWDESGGKLNVGGSAGQTEELVMRYNRPIAEIGSVRIDYNWTAYSGHKARVGLAMSTLVNDPYENSVYLKGVRYQAAGLHAVDGGISNGGYYINYSVPTSGSLMIERNGNDFRASYLNGGWQTLFEAQHDFAGTLLYPYLFTSNSDSNPSWEVALDNFAAQVVPEPSTITLAALGFISLVAWGRRRRSR